MDERIIVFIQDRFRFLRHLREHYNYRALILNDMIFSIMYRINSNFKNMIFNQFKMNTNIIFLEEIKNVTQNLNLPFTIKSLNNRFMIPCLESKLQCICKNTGAKTFEDIILIDSNKTLLEFCEDKSDEFIVHMHFLNRMFVPISYKKCVESDILDLTLYNDINSSVSYDYNMPNLELPKYKKLSKKSMSLIEHVHGVKIYIPGDYCTIVMNGYFIDDSLNVSRTNEFISYKVNDILSKISSSDSFKLNYFNQMSLRDILVYSNDEILELINFSYKKMEKIKDKPIAIIIKEFLNATISEQRELLTLFLIVEDNKDIQYIAYLIYDTISSDPYLAKQGIIADEIYESLHWSVQKIFKASMKTVSDYSKTLIEFSEEDIPYEKRIFMMKVPKNVKVKAMDKYKEILNKGTDSSNKSQQYLDGLLRIPFGIYKKEHILTHLDKFKDKFMVFNPKIKDKNKLKSQEIDNYFNMNNSILESNCKLAELKHMIEQLNEFIPEKINGKGIKKTLLNRINHLILKTTDTGLLQQIMAIVNPNSSGNVGTMKNSWNTYKNEVKDYLNTTKETLDTAVYKQKDAKREMERIIAQWINGEMKGYCLGFEGPPGTGKTSLAKRGIAQCLKDLDGTTRPFAFIAVGGSSNASTLEGHSYTYVGSTWGKIVEILMETKCMNPIIYIDELDKISNTENGKEIIGILTHLTDASQNDHFNDKYFSGIDIDLSKVLFIFSYNDYNLLDSILADRIHRIKFKHLTKTDKIHIIHDYILPEILEVVGFSGDSITIDDETIEYIILSYTYEAGVRKLKERMFEIIREINLRYLTNDLKLPIHIDKTLVTDIFSTTSPMLMKQIAPKSQVGLVNGLFATASGTGGITIIESFKTFSDTKLALTITGQQGKVMKESIECAKTIAWNLIPDMIKKKIKKEWKDNGNYGIHIHCPEASTPKEGPSAGCAITLAFVSLFTNIPVKNTIALTGEIDLNGMAREIGGLDIKIDGGKLAGVQTILYPSQNQEDINIIKQETPEILENIEIHPIETIYDVLEYCLEENDITFN